MRLSLTLLDATIDLILERHRDLLKQGTILVDENDESENIRALVYLEHSIQDARTNANGSRRVVSRKMQYVEIDIEGNARNAGYAPYLDSRPLKDEEKSIVSEMLEKEWRRNDLENQAKGYAISKLVPQHLQELKQRKEEIILKTIVAVKDRLTKEINYWDFRAGELKAQEAAGKPNAKINSEKAQQRADELQGRLQQRLNELEQERKLSPLPPVIVGGALVVPVGLLRRLLGKDTVENTANAKEIVEKLAMTAVMEAEEKLGYEPRDVSSEKCGYDIESRIPGEGLLRFIEVKGRVAGAKTVTVTKNEIISALNKPDNFILALVQVPLIEVSPDNCEIRYVLKPFQSEPHFAATSVNYNL